jgi:hapalindole-type alkaloid chlorinase
MSYTPYNIYKEIEGRIINYRERRKVKTLTRHGSKGINRLGAIVENPNSAEARLRDNPDFAPHPGNEKVLYNFKEVEFQDLKNYPNGLVNLHDRTIDGFLIRNVITPEQAQAIVDAIPNIPTELLSSYSEATTYPKAFAAFKNSGEDKLGNVTFYKQNKEIREGWEQRFGIDICTRIQDVFRSLSTDVAVKTVPSPIDDGEYPFGNIRDFYPNRGKISIHCGLYFQTVYETFYEDLNRLINPENQLSFFVLVQEPEQGGELTLYDLLWDTDMTKAAVGNDLGVFSKKDPEKVYLDLSKPYDCQRIRPRAGDMVIFQAGQIWHKIEYVQGNKNRTTVGGFMAFSHDMKSVYHWS